MDIIKKNFLELKEDSNGFIRYIKNNKLAILTVWFFILLAYGIRLFYYSISIDTEIIIGNYSNQVDSYIVNGRFGLIFTKLIFGIAKFNPYVAVFLMVCTIFVFSMTWSYIFQYFSGEKEKRSISCVIFPILFLTSPLFAEQFVFILQGFEVAFAILLCSLSVFLISKWVIDPSNKVSLIIGLIFMIWSFATYQSIIFLYISGVLACYILIYISNKKGLLSLRNNFFRTAVLKYIITFIVAFALYFLINLAVVSFYGTTNYLDNQILWGKMGFMQCLRNILAYMYHTILGSSFFYSKAYIVIALIILVYAFIIVFSKNKNKLLFLLAVISFLASPYFLSIYLGSNVLERAQFSFQFVIAFGLYFIVTILENRKIKYIGLLLSLILAFGQGYTESRLYYTDYMEYQSEVALANKITARVEELNLGENLNYPVVFVGSYHPAGTPLELRGNVIGSSFFEWDKETPFQCNYRINGFFKTIGYVYVVPTQAQIDKGKEIAKDMKSWPNTECIEFKDDIIVVKLSD